MNAARAHASRVNADVHDRSHSPHLLLLALNASYAEGRATARACAGPTLSLLSTLAAAMAEAIKETAIAETIKETAMAEAKDRLWYVRPLLLFALYLCAGIFFYTNVETKPCADPATPLHMLAPDESVGDSGSGTDIPFGTLSRTTDIVKEECQSNCTIPWTPLDAIYFGVVTMSTVGYGDLYPTTWYSHIFTIVYIFCGILAVFSQLTATVMDLYAPAFTFSRRALTFVLPQPGKVVFQGDGEDDLMLHRKNAAIFYTTRLLGPVLMLFAFQVIFAFAFTAIEPDWDFGVSIYHCLVTATTVGYGDVRIVTNSGKTCAIVHILVSVCALGAIVGDIDTARSERAAEIFRAKQLSQRFDRQKLEHLLADKKFNQDGGGVDKFEFVVGMLLEAEYVKQSDVDAYVTLFERADITGDGTICSADIGHLTAAFDNMWPSHNMVHRALRRSGTRELRALKCNKVAVAPSSSEVRTRWSQAKAGVKVAGETLAANPSGPAGPRPLVEQVNGPALYQGGRLTCSPVPQAGRARSGPAMLTLDPMASPGAIGWHLSASPDQAGSRGAPSSAGTRWSRTGAKVLSEEFSSALEPAINQRSFAELGGARSRVTP